MPRSVIVILAAYAAWMLSLLAVLAVGSETAVMIFGLGSAGLALFVGVPVMLVTGVRHRRSPEYRADLAAEGEDHFRF